MDSDRVIVDPSLLISAEADKRPPEMEYDQFSFSISDSFAQVVRNNDAYVDDSTFEFFTGYLDFPDLVSYGELETVVDEFDTFSGEQAEKAYTEDIDYEEVQATFRKRYPMDSDGKVADVLYDEFVFLFERSWIASRVKKSQNEVTNIPGLRKFIFERDELDAIANKLPQEHQDKIQTLKGGRKWKWIALGIHVGGAAFSGPLGSAIFTTGLAQNSLGLIFDP
ncbi:hypothetical protein [Haloarcula argentinensis]|uniref:Uncharacterized protein n=1 Tax=Haloarcula argentinensis TaxID=43776 RepID=A0A830FS06_HALAR|nr:hypothetical protein [Haloarcula argentinensis]GGM52800.1 hypothetical protein GCM10009006_37420 [Haloarcula argentinensis]